MLLFPAACGRFCAIVCTGRRLVRARVVVWCTSDLASMKHFAIISLRIYCSRGVFFHLYSVFFRHVFNQSQPWICAYETNENDCTFGTSVWYVCTSIFILYCTSIPGIMLQHYYSSVAACTVGTQVDIPYTAVRVHVPGTYIFYRTYFATIMSSSSSSSSAIVASVVCCLPYAIYGSIDSSVLLLLDLNCIQ